MTHSQIIKAMELLEEKFKTLTVEEFDSLAYGDGVFTILENAIDESFGLDKQGCEEFWNDYCASYYDTPNLALMAYTILEHHFYACCEIFELKREANYEIQSQD